MKKYITPTADHVTLESRRATFLSTSNTVSHEQQLSNTLHRNDDVWDAED